MRRGLKRVFTAIGIVALVAVLAPSLVLWRMAYQSRAYPPRSTLLVIPKAGHIPQIEEPAPFRAALTQALANSPPSR